MYVFYVLYIVLDKSTLTLDQCCADAFYPVANDITKKFFNVLRSSTCNLLSSILLSKANKSQTYTTNYKKRPDR